MVRKQHEYVFQYRTPERWRAENLAQQYRNEYKFAKVVREGGEWKVYIRDRPRDRKFGNAVYQFQAIMDNKASLDSLLNVYENSGYDTKVVKTKTRGKDTKDIFGKPTPYHYRVFVKRKNYKRMF
jgi:hypothetical protein